MQTRFQSLDAILQHNQHYWRFEPFHESRNGLTRFSSNQALTAWLSSLELSQVEELKQNPSLLTDALSRFILVTEALSSLSELKDTEYRARRLDSHQASGIPGRKLTQIEAMGSAAMSHHHGQRWLEWCAGKGFLGRMLAVGTKQPVTSFEWQQMLCDIGQAESDKLELPVEFVNGDAFCCEKHQLFSNDLHAVALHACGDLHVVLMKQASLHQIKNLSIAPCCYHLIRDDSYQAMSEYGKASELSLSKNELRIPLQETVTGGERVSRHRHQEMVYRLALDELLRDQTGKDEYQSIPSVKKSQLQFGFEAFCRWASDKKGFELLEADWAEYESRGEARFLNMERLGLVQQLFQRPLELWLVLDKALYLQEQGYQVELSQFCDKKITPRNILIQAALDEN